MLSSCRSACLRRRAARFGGLFSGLIFLGGFVLTASPPAHALTITPTFDVSVTGNVNAAQIEGAINTAINTIDGLYSNVVNAPVTFTYNPAGPGNLLSTNQTYYDASYGTYVNLLKADSAANPLNTVLATAIANLPKGNDSNGSKDMAIAGAQLTMLGIPSAPNSVVNINRNQPFAFSRPVPTTAFDLVGGLEHELDEVLGGGGAGSVLNHLNNPFFADKFGSTDLYRYSAPGTPSFTADPMKTSYFSVDGGTTRIVDLNQNPNGNFGDFAPPGTGPGQLIQNAFNSRGQYEDYTTSSPEFVNLESVGWNPAAVVAVPEPGTLALLTAALLGLSLFGRYRKPR